MEFAQNDIAEVVESLRGPTASGGNVGRDKRRWVRTEVQAKITVAPVINGRVGSAFTDLTSDISATGLGLVQAIPMARSQHLLVRLPRKTKRPLYVLSWVMHCRPLAHGLFALDVEFREPLSVSEEDMLVTDPGAAEAAGQRELGTTGVQAFVVA